MNNLSILISSILSLALLGAIAGAILAYASQKFKVEEDPKIHKVFEALPQTNCGACGHPGCHALAEAIANKTAPVNGCPVGGEKAANTIAEIMGTSTGDAAEKLTARLHCGGGNDKCGKKFDYSGVRSCNAIIMVGGGDKACDYGCLGYGDCVKVCKFDAMKMSNEGLPIIDPEKCTACGLCLKECPRSLIKLVPKKAKILINCSSLDKGPIVRKACKVGCIKCRICGKKCPEQAISFDKPAPAPVLPIVDNDKCEGIKECVKACPTKCIIEL